MSMKRLILLFLIFNSFLYSNTLQKAIDNASAYSTIKLSTGIFLGKIIINKPITIVGVGDNVILKGNNKGTVVTINSSDVILQNLTITDSGNRMDKLDAAIIMDNVNNVKIDGCKLLNSLYGIKIYMTENSHISNNYITSKKNEIGLRGDALKIWYSNNNLIENNTIDNSRDVTLTYANNNKLLNNTFSNNRFATHLSLSKKNLLENNIYKYNSVSILAMGIHDTNIVNNRITSSKGAAGIGLVIKGGSNLLFENNTVSYNGIGLYIDTKYKELGMQRYIKNNTISYNGEALHFHIAIKNNTISNNKIFGNIEDIVQNARVTYLETNIIEYNYWDRYAGFDTNGDNIGDTSHKVFQYADQIWHRNNKLKFFYASPILTIMNFVSELAPFVEPIMMVEDKKPIMNI